MRTVRIVGAAFMVLLGAMLLVAWSVAGKAVEGIEDGSAVTKLTQKMLDDPDFADAAAGRITDRLVEQTEGRFIGRVIVAFEPELQRAIANVLSSDRVEEAVTTGLEKLESRLTEEITDPDRPSGPLVVSVDLSERVNNRIDQIPVVGPLIPEVTVPPIEREVMDAETFDSVRQIYGGLKFVATWGLIVAIAMIVGGFFVAPRSRWYWPQALLGTAFIVLAISIAVRRIIPAQIASAVPGGETGGGGTFLSNFVADNATGPLASRLLAMAFWAFLLAVGFVLVARFLPGWREQFVAVRTAPATESVAAEPVVTSASAAAPVAAEAIPAPAPVAAEPADAVIVEPVSDVPPLSSDLEATAALSAADSAERAEAQAEAAEIVAALEAEESPAMEDPAAVAAAAEEAAKPAAKRAPAARATTSKAAATKSTPARAAAKKPASDKAQEKPAPRTSSRARKPAVPKDEPTDGPKE